MTPTPGQRRFLKFLAVGGLNTAFGYAVYAVLVLAGVAPQPALAAAFCIGVIWNFFTHARLVFGARGFRRLPAYVAVYVGIYAVNAFLLARVMALGIHPLAAQAGLALVMAVLSYGLIKAVLTGGTGQGGRHSGSV